jgi:hypothetical protein
LKRNLLFLALLFISVSGLSQNALEETVSDVKEEQPLSTFLLEYEKQHQVRFFFQEEWLTGYTITPQANGKTLLNALTEILKYTDIDFTGMFGYAVIFAKDASVDVARDSILRSASAAKKEIEEYTLGNKATYKPGKQVTLSGVVKDEFSSATLAGVLIMLNGKHISESNSTGHYSISLPAGEQLVEFHFGNYRDKVIDVKIYENSTLGIVLEEMPVVLDEVVVSDQAIVNRRVGQISLKMTELKRSPTFLGEIDIIKQIQNQPGVTTVGEVASGFNVRGGGVDQNLVLYDGVPIFNTSHALGFFTAFNSDAVGQVSFYRGGIPAEYGGRVSSVLNITSKEGPYDKWRGTGGIGIISSHLSLGGPIKRDTTSLLVSVRASYSDWVLHSVKSNYQNVKNSSVAFYDASMKFTHKYSKKTKLTLSGYASNDRFSFTNDSIYGTRNLAGLVQLDHTFSDRLYGSIAASFGRYSYSVVEEDKNAAFKLQYSITYPALRMDFNYDGNQHKLSFGLHNTYYNFAPGNLKPTTEESYTSNVKIPSERSLESAIYLSDAFQLRENILIEGGMRVSMFNRMGAGTIYHYHPDAPMETRNITDSTNYTSGQIMKTYFGLEPRLSIRYSLGVNASVKLGYNRMYQYMHLVTNTAAVTPVDIWQSSNAYFRPQIADQLSLGYYRNLKDDTYETFAEVFYKAVQNTLDFKDGANLILNRHLETALLKGRGRSYGVEFSISKIKGRLLGTLNYTYSRSFRTTNGTFDSEKINKGKEYASNYDQPHVATINWRYNVSRRYFFSGMFTYHTGRPMSLPVSAYTVDGVPIPDFSERNRYRIPDYHRLDLAFIMEGNHKRKKIWDGTWTISVYNVYARKNAYSVFFKDDGDGRLKPYKLSVIGTAIPSLSYSFKF